MRSHHPATGVHPIESLESRRLLSAGDPDQTFGLGGRAEFPRGNNISFSDSIVLSNDKVLFAGTISTLFIADREQYVLRRFNADGSLDTTFGTNGTASGFFDNAPGSDSRLTQIGIQSDGKIIGRAEASFKQLIVRFNANGSLDTTFGGGDGIVEILADHIKLQPDDKILVAREALTRLNADGSVDMSFGTNGTPRCRPA